ncbi:transposase [Ancylomarina euxinus]|uniref:Transposase n=2 Tax=Ancylomarina euxinus TaxID=2283627 RepID=A0A425Y8B7_9BACT|nr:transposase [Ancylomarina euxinus]
MGKIEGGQMHLSAIGKQANLYWSKIPQHFPHIELGEFIIMPNHIHGIIGIVHPHHHSVRSRHGVTSEYQPESNQNNTNQFGKTIAGSISAIIGQFKSSLTRWSRKNGHDYFAWQARFHDHIIRNEDAFKRIADYIKNNPANWQKDKSRTQKL